MQRGLLICFCVGVGPGPRWVGFANDRPMKSAIRNGWQEGRAREESEPEKQIHAASGQQENVMTNNTKKM